jgi:hypothetical protein
MAIVAALGYAEGVRTSKRIASSNSSELARLRRERNQLQHDYSITRRDAAHALELLTEERDDAQAEAAGLRLRLISAQEQLQTLRPQNQVRAA